MKKLTSNHFIYFGLGIIAFNFLMHLFKIREVYAPFGINAVTTLFTSLSLFFSFMALQGFPKELRVFFTFISILIQFLSLILLTSDNYSTIPFLVPSSIPTSLYLITVNTLLIFKVTNTGAKKIRIHLSFFSLMLGLFFTYAFLNQYLFILGVSENILGLGMSPYTLISIFIISTILFFQEVEVPKFNKAGLNFSPIGVVCFFALTSSLNILLLIYNGNNQLIYGLIINFSALIIIYFYLLVPLMKSKNKIQTICAWSKQIKLKDGRWVDYETYLNSLGFQVSHGISPEELEKKQKNLNSNR